MVKEATVLSEAGYSVCVIKGEYNPAHAGEDKLLFGSLPITVTAVPFGPHTSLARYVRQSGLRRLARAAIAVGLDLQVFATLSVEPVASDLVRVALKVPARLYVAHYDGALPAAAAAAKRFSAPYAFDGEDFHIGQLGEGPADAVDRRIIELVERKRLNGAAFVTAASPGIAKAYSDRYGIPLPLVIRNVFPRSHAPEAVTLSGTASPGPSVYWVSQTIGPERGLETAVEALSLARSKPHLYLRGKPFGDFFEDLRRKAKVLGVDEQLHLLPLAPPPELERLASTFDLALCSEPGGTLNNMILESNKLFSFILAGVPPLLSDTPSQVAFSQEAGLPELVYRRDDPQALASLIDSCLVSPVKLQQLRRQVWDLGVQKYNWDIEKLKLLKLISSLLASDVRDA